MHEIVKKKIKKLNNNIIFEIVFMSSLIKTLSLPHILIILDLILMVDYIKIAKPNETFSHLKQNYHMVNYYLLT